VATGGSGIGTSANGGAICVQSGTATIDRSTLNLNSVTRSGATQFNTASGGAVYNFGTVSIERSTIVNNTSTASGTMASASGGGVSNSGTMTLTSDTIANNSATGGGPNLSNGGTATVRNTILALPNGNNVGDSCVGTITSGDYNLEAGSMGSPATSCDLTAAHDLTTVLPHLLGLADNGGPTRTRALDDGSVMMRSPAIDAGSSFGETTDQREGGFVRPSDFPADPNAGDGADIGAYELKAPPTAPTLIATAPASPANDNNPSVIGSAEASSTVALYTNAGCSGTPVASGGAAAFASPGLTVSVLDNSTTSFYAKATDLLSQTSSCSSGSVVYVEDSTSPPTPTPTPTATKKKCKKKAKKTVVAAKKKCKKKK
jgi:hypothetical protein